MVLDVKAVVGVLGALMFALGIALLAPMGVALFYGEPQWWGFGVTAVGTLVGGGVLWAVYRPKDEIRIREGFAIVALAWFVLSLVGALPFVITGVLGSYTDAFFETMSGFTTTGATILGGADTPAIEEIPNAFLFWRSLTQWMGGMGIIVLALAVLPLLGIGGMQLFKAEAPGLQADKLTPRVTDTAKRLWVIYVGLTLVEVLLLLPAMSLFDAVIHAFSTMATGGFSNQSGSVGQYGSAYVEWVIIVFMVLAGINFTLHYLILHGKIGQVLKSEELRVYITILVGATALLTVVLWNQADFAVPDAVTLSGEIVEREIVSSGGEGFTVDETHGRPIVHYNSFWASVRYAAFQATAVMTTTGFGTADYELWPPLAISILFALFFVGGMAGSTSGGVKVVRVLLILKNSFREFKQLLHPQAVIPIRLDHRVVSDSIMKNILSFIVLYIGLIGVGTLIMGFLGLDLMSAFSATFSSVGNVGPTFGTFGPTESYTHVPVAGKWVLSFLMMAGRLEIFTVLMLFSPYFWKR